MASGFVFPGQGSQSIGMLADHIADASVVAQCFAQAEDALGLPLLQYVTEGPESELNRTEITQPAVLTASVALWRLWLAEGGAKPVAMCGHSLGEYSALVCAGALEFRDAVKLVNLRGQLMQAAVPAGSGAMAAILGLEDSVVAQCCASVSGTVSPANFNSPGQIVIAGEAAAVDAAIAACQAAGAKRAMKLAVSVPSHCALMKGAASQFADAIAATPFELPSIPVIHNVDASVSRDVGELREKLLRQMSEPVQWTDCIARMASLGVERAIECGPGRVLAGLIKRIDRAIDVAATDTKSAFGAALAGTSP
ncbi:MAG: ACP S-malonyltransferase [Gammaproteobacteria bacterium]|nr:ACP S-malonyltransferase [Gammaproteobacteria bacterium]